MIVGKKGLVNILCAEAFLAVREGSEWVWLSGTAVTLQATEIGLL